MNSVVKSLFQHSNYFDDNEVDIFWKMRLIFDPFQFLVLDCVYTE